MHHSVPLEMSSAQNKRFGKKSHAIHSSSMQHGTVSELQEHQQQLEELGAELAHYQSAYHELDTQHSTLVGEGGGGAGGGAECSIYT